MFLIIYSGQRYKIKIRKTNLRTIIFSWERELGGDGEEGRESWGGRQGRLGTDRGPLETEGRLAGNGRQGQVGTRERTAGDGLRPLSAVP